MSEKQPLIITLNENSETSACHKCGNSTELVHIDCQDDGKSKAEIYCESCNEFSNAPLVLVDSK